MPASCAPLPYSPVNIQTSTSGGAQPNLGIPALQVVQGSTVAGTNPLVSIDTQSAGNLFPFKIFSECGVREAGGRALPTALPNPAHSRAHSARDLGFCVLTPALPTDGGANPTALIISDGTIMGG